MKRKTTKWFTGVNPHHVGVYQRKPEAGIVYALWNGRSWMAYTDSPTSASNMHSLSMYQSWNVPWRGLVHKNK